MTKILVVDDDLIVLSTLAMGLSRVGYEVMQADNGFDAIVFAKDNPPDFAILDMRMPGMTGLAVAQVFKTELHIPFMFLSAFNDDELIRHAAEAGAMGYLVKPVEIQQIISSIEVALVRSDNLSQLEQNNANLAATLNINREIDVAVGLIMAQQAVDRATAFARLRSYARNHREKVHEVACRLIDGEAITLEGS